VAGSSDARHIVEAGYDALVDRYGSWAGATDDPGRERLLGELMARLADGARVLDLGCGSGVPSTQVLAQRFAVTGVDLSAGQLAAARRNVPGARLVQGDLATIELPARSWDAVTAFYALAHVPRSEHAAVFARVARWLVPGGLFLATFGAGDSPDWTGDWLGRPMFFSSHDPATNRALLEAAGFDLLVDEVIPTLEPEGPVPFHWVLAQTRAAP
jgi:cyclopropane fatty-acyl-phospholipid synthase-like methyltransferase